MGADRLRNPETLVGQVLAGKYKICAVLGEGGMGVVLEAENTVIRRPVAIKILHSNLVSDETTVERFNIEARAAAATGHDHIVEVLDLGSTEDGIPFIVMELLEGINLQKVLKVQGTLEVDRTCRIAVQVLSALSAVHARGIVHRDLKPANIILTKRAGRSDFVKLVDFGISKFREARAERGDLTATGVVLGTPHYMAPEQARGEGQITHLVDLYAVGAIMYRCLSGQVPYRGTNYNQILAKILAQSPVPLEEIRPEIPEPVISLVSKAMAHEPKRRFQSAVEFAQAISSQGLAEIVIQVTERKTSSTIDPVSSGADPTFKLATPSSLRGAERPSSGTMPLMERPRVPSGRTSSVHTSPSLARPRESTASETAPASSIRSRKVWKRWVLLSGLALLALLSSWLLIRLAMRKRSPGSGRAATRDRKPSLTLSFGQYMPRQSVMKAMQEMASYLGSRLDRTIKVLVADEFHQVGRMLATGKVDLAFLSPLLYVQAKKKHPSIKLLCAIRTKGTSTYQGLVIARADKEINKLEDLKGKSFCWVSRHSTSGYLFPLAMMLERGITPNRDFRREYMTGYHHEALRRIEAGICDAAAVFSDTYFKAKVQGSIKTGLHVVAATSPIPRDAVCAGKRVEGALLVEIRKALLEFDPSRHNKGHNLAGDFSISSFFKVEDSFYDPIRRVMERVSSYHEQVRPSLTD